MPLFTPGCQCCVSPTPTPCRQVCAFVGGCNGFPIDGASVTIGSLGTGTTGGVVASANVTAAGTGYTSAPTVAFSGGGGSGATATATIVNIVSSLSITNGGTGYTSAPTISFSGGGGAGAVAASHLTAGVVTSITVSSHGSGYTTAPSVSMTAPGSGVTATATASLTGVVAGPLSMVAAGNGYTSAPTISFSGGGGSGATGTATLGDGEVCLPAYTTGSFSVTATAPSVAWWSTTPVTGTASVGSCSSTAASTSLTLSPATNYVCHCTFCQDPMPNTVTCTDALQSTTLTWTVGSQTGWHGSYTQASRTVQNSSLGTCSAGTHSGLLLVDYWLLCPAALGMPFTLIQGTNSCSTSGVINLTTPSDQTPFPSPANIWQIQNLAGSLSPKGCISAFPLTCSFSSPAPQPGTATVTV